jgi:hypothetical protein
MIGTLVRRLLPLSLCSLCGTVLLAFAFSHELLSPRGLGVVLLILGIGVGTWAVFVIRKTTRELKVSRVTPPGSSVPPNISKLRLGMLVGKLSIVALAVFFFFGLRQDGPLWPRLV